MKLGTPLRQRDLVLVPIPFTDLSSNKKRPVSLRKEGMEEGELLRESEIRADKIYAVNQGIVVKRFSRIKEDIFREVIKKISVLIEARAA